MNGIGTQIDVCRYRLDLFMMVLVIRVISSIRHFIVGTNGFSRGLLMIIRCFFGFRYITNRCKGVLRRSYAYIFTASAISDGRRDFYRVATYARRLSLLTCLLMECATNSSMIIELACFARRIIVFMLGEEDISECFDARLFRSFQRFKAPRCNRI